MNDFYQSNLEGYLASHHEKMMQGLLDEVASLTERNSQELYRQYTTIYKFSNSLISFLVGRVRSG